MDYISKKIKRKELTKEQEKLLNKLYYEDKQFFGRDKLFELLKEKYPEYKISRRQLLAWLKNQEVYQINLKAPRDLSIKRFNPTKKGYLQIDLIDMSSNPERGFYWIITAIDIFTKFAVALPLKSKKKTSVVKLLDKIVDIYDKITVIQTDQGDEFDIPSFYEKNNIKHITSKAYTPQSQGIIERFNGTIKRLIDINRQITGKKMWIDDLPKLVENYNESIHSYTKSKPVDGVVVDNIKKELSSPSVARLDKLEKILKVGDDVRVKLIKSKLDKKNTQNYSDDVYTIERVIKPKKEFERLYYKLKDVKGYYNSSQIIPIKFDNNIKIL